MTQTKRTAVSGRFQSKPSKLSKKSRSLKGRKTLLPEKSSPIVIKLSKAFERSAFRDKMPLLTRLVVKCNVGFGNSLYIRGQGAGLSWEKGLPLKNVSATEWIWETRHSFVQCEFKLLINDNEYELSDNHQLESGQIVHYSPSFEAIPK